MEAVIQGNPIDEQIQLHLEQYHQRKNYMISSMETQIHHINNFLENYDSTKQSMKKGRRFSSARKTHSRRQGVLDTYTQRKQSISIFQVAES